MKHTNNIEKMSNQANEYKTGGILPDNIDSAIAKLKTSLIAKAKKKGIYENFGQDEVRQLEDKFGFNSKVSDFDLWVMDFDNSSYAKGGYIEIVSNNGYGKVINDLYNMWNNVKTDKQYKAWVEKVRKTTFGTYGTISIDDVLKNFDFDNAPINSVNKEGFKKEVQNAFDYPFKYAKGGTPEGYFNEGDKVYVINEDMEGDNWFGTIVEAGETHSDVKTPNGDVITVVNTDISKEGEFAKGGEVEKMYCIKKDGLYLTGRNYQYKFTDNFELRYRWNESEKENAEKIAENFNAKLVPDEMHTAYAKGGGVGNQTWTIRDYNDYYVESDLNETKLISWAMQLAKENGENVKINSSKDAIAYIEKRDKNGNQNFEVYEYAKGGNTYSSDELYIVKVYDAKSKNLLDMSRRVWAKNKKEAEFKVQDEIEYDMKQKYGDHLRFVIEEAPQMYAKGGKFDVISPDGFSIDRSDTYTTKEEAMKAFSEWKKRYQAQGYYSSNEGHIPLNELDNYCRIVEKKNGKTIEYTLKGQRFADGGNVRQNTTWEIKLLLPYKAGNKTKHITLGPKANSFDVKMAIERKIAGGDDDFKNGEILSVKQIFTNKFADGGNIDDITPYDYLRTLDFSALPKDFADYVQTEILTDPDIKSLSSKEPIFLEIKEKIENIHNEMAISGNEDSDRAETLEAISFLKILLEDQKGAEKKETLEAISFLKELI